MELTNEQRKYLGLELIEPRRVVQYSKSEEVARRLLQGKRVD